jgi:hypothetical protein
MNYLEKKFMKLDHWIRISKFRESASIIILSDPNPTILHDPDLETSLKYSFYFMKVSTLGWLQNNLDSCPIPSLTDGTGSY